MTPEKWMTLERWMTLEKLMNSSPLLYMQAVQREVGNGLAGFISIPRQWETRLKPVACLEAPGPPPPHSGNKKESGCMGKGTGE